MKVNPQTNSTGARLVMVRQELDLSQTQMAKQLGIAQSTLSQLESGRSQPNAEVLSKLIEAQGVSSDWLLTGRGARFIADRIAEQTIPLIDADAKAGYRESKASAEYLETLSRYRIPSFEDGGDYRIFEVEGDSMVPTLYPNDYVICELVPSIRQIEDNTLAVVFTEELLVVKRVSFFEDGAGSLILRSDNTSYTPRMVSLADVVDVWSVRGRLTTAVDHALFRDNLKLLSLEAQIAQMREELDELKTGDSKP